MARDVLTDPWKLGELKGWAPLFRNPFTDIFGCVMTHQSGFKCQDFEARFGDCMEAYGPHRGAKECRVYFNDLMECSRMTKQVKRVQEMRAERKRQYKAGELKERYAPPPKIDAF
ncbi:NADH dehydrogenase [ubiquinone] iron-sulfur protein 5-like [Pollicipes pollicipes]|uniref:NADH dehydrogenase [ubiquinone] iron-sulfur protein 5-like n=1 Tax=Pollicipes pollicipes TaxID=41117 RepID=UPI001884A46D|nr:NADH dehydrogenase [ubiquinone] iron-sulfur protein 5-like [Pollicipes pollicipes]XP_037075897.1 NADH dehydrogenase [ubiquinone] iron-sulfur protein 5-like [Pollicipes pollicipes]